MADAADAAEKQQIATSAADIPIVNLSYILRKGEYRKALYSGVITLTLSILGGAVLPVSAAFSVTGIVCGFLIMLVVAAANSYTCDLLLRQAYYTDASDYESLAFLVGGKWWKLTTEISIVVLLLGTIVGSIQQVGEAGVMGLLSISSNIPHWLVGTGRLLTVIFVVAVIAPICLVEKMRQLEHVATIGTIIVLWLLGVIVVDAIKNNLPAVHDGELLSIGFTSIGSVTQAVSTFGFAFYVQPMMMPFLAEMPAGKVGMKLTSYSTRTVIMGTSFFIYGAIGFFGAARYGKDTASNILENRWLGGGIAQGILNLAMSIYLAISISPLEFPTRHTINQWLPGDLQKRKRLRHYFISATILSFCTGVSLIWPNKSGTIVTITGATGVCMVSYLIPIVNHLLLFFQRAKCQREVNANNDVLSYRKSGIQSGFVREYSLQVALPLIVIFVGLFCSVAALTTLN